MTVDLRQMIAAELRAPVRPEVRELASRLADGARRPPLAVLFYGSALRTESLDGILDFYVVVERLDDWSHGKAAARANGLLPPNVEYHEFPFADGVIRAKVAILSLGQFNRLCSPKSLDNSVWARFSQPVACAFVRDSRAEESTVLAVAAAVATAVFWAVRLGPAEARPADFWRALFHRTYASELRVEKPGRSASIVDHAPERYNRLLRAACDGAGVGLETLPDGKVRPSVTARQRAQAARAWRRRSGLAKPLNIARLAKAAFTFRGGADYIVWKIERHSGATITLSAWQRRHPLLGSGLILWQLWRRRASA